MKPPKNLKEEVFLSNIFSIPNIYSQNIMADMERRRISIPRSLISPRMKEELVVIPRTKSLMKKSRRELELTLKTSLPWSLNVFKKILKLNKLRFKNLNKSRRVINSLEFSRRNYLYRQTKV